MRIANGRDAADAAVACVFGEAQLLTIKIGCELVSGQKFKALKHTGLKRKGVSLDAIGDGKSTGKAQD